MAESKGIREAFDEAVSAFIAWDRGGEEPTVMFNNVPIPISTIAGLAEVITDPMPASVFWRMVSYAKRFVDDHRAEGGRIE
jgi:hypothetical protein